MIYITNLSSPNRFSLGQVLKHVQIICHSRGAKTRPNWQGYWKHRSENEQIVTFHQKMASQLVPFFNFKQFLFKFLLITPPVM